MDTVGEADIVGTGRVETVIDPVVAEVTLLGDSVISVKPDCIIRTCLYAGAAT